MTVSASWLARRLFPLLAAVLVIVTGMVSTTWGPHLLGRSAWALPNDIWGTLIAARRLLHLDLGGLYTAPTGLVSFPGTALILVPVVAVIDAAGIGLAAQGPQNIRPEAWLLAGTYDMAISAVALIAADSVAERLGVTRPKRALLAAAEGVALWSVAVRWGHPEDAVAVGLLVFGILALSDSRARRSAWLIGAAIAVQPLVLLALPVVLAILEPRRLAGFLTRAASPSALLLGAAAAANWPATFQSVTRQPNWPAIDHTTPWTALAPRLSNGAVAAGPARVLAIVLACGCAVVVGRRWRLTRHNAGRSPEALRELLWWVALALAARCVFESVMVAYYLWPALAVALIAASSSWSRLIKTAIAASVLTVLAQAPWHDVWVWWAPVTAGLALTLYFAGPERSDEEEGQAYLAEVVPRQTLPPGR
jgi:hypothetical protein